MGKEKVKVPDYDKLTKLNEETLKQLPKSKNPEELMIKYRSQRNKLLGALGVAVITLGSGIFFLNKYKNKKINELTGMVEVSEKNVKMVSAENSDLKIKNAELENQGNDTNKKLMILISSFKKHQQKTLLKKLN